MREPHFWTVTEGREAAKLTRTLLTPLSWAYAAAGRARLDRADPYVAAAPVICVGNVTMGGAGKTPVARAVLAALRARGVAAHALSRGHGGADAGPLRVDLEAHSYRDVGDEPLLLGRDGPAWIARDRAEGAKAAEGAGARAIVMDDGFQNPSLHKDLSLLVIDAAQPYGNGRIFPAGPLRESVSDATRRADAVVLMLPDPGFPFDVCALHLDLLGKPILAAWLEPVAPAPAGPLVAFAGIGRPQKFFDTLRAAGAQIAEETGFPDHHPYSPADLALLRRIAEERGAALVTTEKDHVRLPPQMRAAVHAFPVTARFAEPSVLGALLARAMDAKSMDARSGRG